tara:strand:+ start:397 stop:636 length:240 start_codon:yes stop_codon:yes gene_type:complete
MVAAEVAQKQLVLLVQVLALVSEAMVFQVLLQARLLLGALVVLRKMQVALKLGQQTQGTVALVVVVSTKVVPASLSSAT